MLIIEALRRAETAREVCSLMTKYVETLVSCDTTRHLPAGVTSRPVRGLVDTAARLACLLDLQDAEPIHTSASTDYGIVEQAAQLFREGLNRLNALNAANDRAFSFGAHAARAVA
jgi:hypothetical protein